MPTLEGQGAVVTGCASGIGLAIARRFLDEGAHVLGVDVNACELAGDRFRLLQGSVAEEAVIEAALEELIGWAGRLDVMVNNAAIQLELTLDDTSVEQFDQLLAVNLRGVFLGTRHAARRMHEGGRIINLGSILGLTGDPLLAAYSATKGGVVNLTRAAAAGYGKRGIRVNCLCPGAVRTELTTRVWDMAPDPDAARRAMESVYPLDRIAEPAEIAAAALFLASDQSSAMTGAALVVDCGLTATNAEYSLVKDLL
jgi:NAD(P)-dependent dehydrogenase (short-subunit alcohol dehydrogenase family)